MEQEPEKVNSEPIQQCVEAFSALPARLCEQDAIFIRAETVPRKAAALVALFHRFAFSSSQASFLFGLGYEDVLKHDGPEKKKTDRRCDKLFTPLRVSHFQVSTPLDVLFGERR